jgi:hypothetical protein
VGPAPSLSTPNKSSTDNTSRPLKEEWTKDDIKVFCDSVKKFTDEQGRTNWPEVNKIFPKHQPDLSMVKFVENK